MKRTPRNYDGIAKPEKMLQDLLSDCLWKIQTKRVEPENDLLKAWPSIIGPKLAKMTEAVSFIDGILTIKVRSSALYSLLSVHEKPQILSKLQESFPKTQVRNVFFRIG